MTIHKSITSALVVYDYTALDGQSGILNPGLRLSQVFVCRISGSSSTFMAAERKLRSDVLFNLSATSSCCFNTGTMGHPGWQLTYITFIQKRFLMRGVLFPYNNTKHLLYIKWSHNKALEKNRGPLGGIYIELVSLQVFLCKCALLWSLQKLAETHKKIIGIWF